jgi:hypothetical protein
MAQYFGLEGTRSTTVFASMSGAAAKNPKPTKPLPYQKKQQRLLV